MPYYIDTLYYMDLKPVNSKIISVVDLFAGCGGLSLGFQNAGFKIVAAYDNWDEAINIYKRNFNHPIFNRDLNDIEDFNNLDNVQKDYVKKRIENAYTDENGNIKYDIKAIVHDGDTMASIINRFYTKEEQQKLNVAENDYNTQIAGQKIKNPASGDTIVANGVSEYGLKALIEDAKQGINRDGE